LLKIATEVSGDIFIVRCTGRIVFGDEAAAFRERLVQLLLGTPNVLVNLSGVDYVDSRGLGILVAILVSSVKRGGELKLVAPSKRVAEALQRTHLDKVFMIYRDEGEGLAAFGSDEQHRQSR
jgi:anti-sigma B factor antagonist